ncbi:MAG: class I SAM-dependent methyltransferase [Polyangia bacterium]
MRTERYTFDPPYKLHLGCGTVRFDGWINIDADPKLDTVDLRWDLGRSIPVGDGTCRLLFSEHLLEHLPPDRGVAFLKECRRVLQPGGVVRIAMPSLENILAKAVSEDWRDQDWLRWPEYQFIETRAEMINIAFRWWGHQWLYDREELHRRLREAGFEQIHDVERGQSAHPELRERETRLDSLLCAEAVR